MLEQYVQIVQAYDMYVYALAPPHCNNILEYSNLFCIFYIVYSLYTILIFIIFNIYVLFMFFIYILALFCYISLIMSNAY